MFCNKCGSQLEEHAAFCSKCGSSVEAESKPAVDKTKRTRKCTGLIAAVIVLVVLLVCESVLLIFERTNSTEDVPGTPSETTAHGMYSEEIEVAISALTEKWTELYSKDSNDGYLEIYHTRIIEITPDANDTFFTKLDRGTEIKYVVEFSLYSDFYGSAPYYHNIATYDTVLLYNDGTAEVVDSFFRKYIGTTYVYQFAFIDDIIDLGSEYNQVFNIK